MRVKLILLVIALFLLSSCSYEQNSDQIEQQELLIFVIDESQITEQPIEPKINIPKMKVFVIEESTGLEWFDETKQQRYQQNLRRYTDEYEDEQEEFEIKNKLKNVRRMVENDFGEEELIIGYVKELDNPDFKEVDY